MRSSRNNEKSVSFEEWSRRFLKNKRALNQVTHSEVEQKVVMELLFHQVMGNYWLGASPRDWKAFRSELISLRRKAKIFKVEVTRLRSLKIFSLPRKPSAFVTRENDRFSWRLLIESPTHARFDPVVKALEEFHQYMDQIIKWGDMLWNYREFGNLNLVFLSMFVKRTTGEWQDANIAGLAAAAYAAAGKKWKPEKKPPAAVAELRRRFFSVPHERLKWLLRATHQSTADRRWLNQRRRERHARGQDPEPPFINDLSDPAHLEWAEDRALAKLKIIRDVSGFMDEFVRSIGTEYTKAAKDSLLGFINLAMLSELKSSDLMRAVLDRGVLVLRALAEDDYTGWPEWKGARQHHDRAPIEPQTRIRKKRTAPARLMYKASHKRRTSDD